MGELEGKSLCSCLIAATFGIQAESSHLVLDLAKDLIGRSRSLDPDILHALELLSQILLNRLNEEMQV